MATSPAPLIVLDRLSKHFGAGRARVDVLKNIDMAVERGEFIAVMGPSGSGKSTLLNIVGGLDVPSAGVYRFAGADIAAAGVTRRAAFRNRSVGFVFQNANLLARGTAFENIELPLIYRGFTRRQRRERVAAALDAVGLTGRARHFPAELSGGERQRIAFARAIVTAPDLLLADEPTGSLDTANGDLVMELLLKMHALGITVVLVTHDPDRARSATRVIRLADGAVVGSGGREARAEAPLS